MATITISAGLEDLFFDAPLHIIPRLELDGSGLDRGHASFDLDLPSRVSAGVRRPIKAREKFRGHLGSSIEVESQRVGQHRFRGLGHASILRSDAPPNKRLHPVCRSRRAVDICR